ncbi:Dihydroflavonol-4-reductase [Drechslerella dactyloides]|uniref:Dihydroflavonol-4-reductase n=1 Tax=Drechslerella dactyloides TaxID=74499 RepID=A0AAD6J202_DREDA|nr:Dihydroflavonol-4-reductase [Drechslerella dactyloides]
MSTSQKPIALVTGITGYIAGWVAKYFLDAGYIVRGTTRSKRSAQPLIDALVEKGYAASDIQIYEVADITVPGAFDAAVKDVEAIAHLATPVTLSASDPDPVIHTAVEGALSILRSAKAHGNALKTFVQMSSVVAVVNPREPAFKPPHVFDETNWNDASYQAIKQLGKNSPGPLIYGASKNESERAVWRFRDEEKPSFSVVSINPGWVSGPPVILPTDASKISVTIQTIWDIFSGKKEWFPLGRFAAYVHVFDVARLFVWAAQNGKKADGERYLAVGGHGSEQAIQDTLREAYPERRDVIVEGEKGKGYFEGYAFDPEWYGLDVTKAVKATGQDWIKYDQVIRDTAKAFEHLVTA